MALATMSIPSCMQVELAQLEQLRDKGAINNYEFSADGSLVTLYWTYVKQQEIK